MEKTIKIIKLIISLVLMLALAISASGCATTLLRRIYKTNAERQAENEAWIANKDWSDDYAIVYLDKGIDSSGENRIPYSKYKQKTFTIKSPLEKGGFFENGYEYTLGYQIFNGQYYVNTMKYIDGCADDAPVTIYILRVDPPFTNACFDVVYEYQTTYANRCIYYSTMDKYIVREYPGLIHFIDPATKEFTSFDLDTGAHLFSVAYAEEYYLETWFDEEVKTVSFKVYDRDLNVYTTSAYDIGWYLDARRKVWKDFQPSYYYDFNVYEDYVIFGHNYDGAPEPCRLVNYKTDSLIQDKDLAAEIYDLAQDHKNTFWSEKFTRERTVEIEGVRGFVEVLGGAIRLYDYAKNEQGVRDVLWERYLSDLPALAEYYEQLEPLSSQDVFYNDGRIFFALYSDIPWMGLFTVDHKVPTMVFGYDLATDAVEYIGFLSTDQRNDLIGVYKVPNKEDFD